MTISLFTKCLFEFIGTALLILLGDGVVASSLLKHSKGFGGGWVVITFAWGFAVMCGAFVAAPYSGAHLNPALSIGLALAHTFPWAYVFRRSYRLCYQSGPGFASPFRSFCFTDPG